MFRLVRSIVAGGTLALSLTSLHAFAAETTLTDDADRQVTLDLPVKRAVVFNAINLELFRAVGGMDSVVGVDAGAQKATAYWPGIPESAVVGQGQAAPNYEAIVALKPDLVVFPRNGAWQEAEERLKPFNIPVMVITGWDPLKHSENARQIGKLLDKSDRGEELAAFYEDNVKLLADRLEGVERKSIYMEKVPSLYTPIPGSGWHDMIVSGGGDSIFAEVDFAKESSSRGSVHEFSIAAEDIFVDNPQVIIKLVCCEGGYNPPGEADLKAAVDEIKGRPGWDQITAVRNDDVHVFSIFAGNVVSKMIGSVYIAKALYPDRFADIDPNALMRTWLEDFQQLPYLGPYGHSPLGRY